MNAESVIELVADCADIQVVGTSAFADEVRRLLAERARPPHDRPGAIIETTGEPAAIEAALVHVADLGTIVIAGPPPVSPLRMDLYPDVHVRGLTLIGVVPLQ